jgi:hypothetical protein
MRGGIPRNFAKFHDSCYRPGGVTRAPSAVSSHSARLRQVCIGVLATLAAFGVSGTGCGTAAVGIDACRDIETARCEAAQHCGRVDDVEACQRYYRDHCLHGLAEGVEPPTPDQVDACVKVIERAGQCAKDDRAARLDTCDQVVSDDPRGAELACQIVLLPEWATECAFLGPRGDLPDRPGDGGQGGTGPTAGGQGGAT